MAEQKTEMKEPTGFPPKAGELMIRKLYQTSHNPDVPGEKGWELLKTTLGYFDEVKGPGEQWHDQQIAVNPYGDKNYGEPSFGSGTDSATDGESVISSGGKKIEHSHATQADLESMTALVAQYYEKRNPGRGKKDLQSWLEQVKRSDVLLPTEKTRLELACAKSL